MDDDQLHALRAVADAAYGYLSASRADAPKWRAELAEALAQLIMALEEPLPPDDDDPAPRLRLLPVPEGPTTTACRRRGGRR